MTIFCIMWTYCTYTYYTHYDILTIPVSISNWSSTVDTLNGTIFGIHEMYSKQPHDMFLDIQIINNEHLMTVRTMTVTIKTLVGDYSRMLHMYPHSNVVWWVWKSLTCWYTVLSPYEHTHSRHLLMSNVFMSDVLTKSDEKDKHVDLFCSPLPCNTPFVQKYNHINTVTKIGQLQIQKLFTSVWPDIVHVNILLIPSFTVGIHSIIRNYPFFYFLSTYIFFTVYSLVGVCVIVQYFFPGNIFIPFL
jgi:hypothetical protein